MSEAHMPVETEVLVVGAGFAGLYLIHELRRLGVQVHAVEAGDDVGGTWYWNRYPGARCDVESIEYSYSFSPLLDKEWSWTERYASQPEILRYLQFVAERLDLRRHVSFDTRVLSMAFDASNSRWLVETTRCPVTAKFCVMATGCLSVKNFPKLPGLGEFAGSLYHTADWPLQGVDFTGRRVGVIGTGSSGCQAIPLIADQAKELVVFQRTANYCLPAENQSLDPAYYEYIKQNYPALRQKWRSTFIASGIPFGNRSALAVPARERHMVYEHRWAVGGGGFFTAFDDLLSNRASNDTAAEFVRAKIRALVHDPDVAEQLCPGDIALGAKRVPLVTGYFETFNRPNVRLVSASRAPIERIVPSGVVAGASVIELDDLVFATGFDAMTGALSAIDIKGRDGQTLRSVWAEGPTSYLGLMIAGFPNLFLVTGPGSPSVLSNVVVSIEQHVRWIGECISHLSRRAITSIEADSAAQADWMQQVAQAAARTLFGTAKSWYSGDNVDGKPHSAVGPRGS